jgi:hypothetical protein
MTELRYIEVELRSLIRDLEVNKAHCPDDWDACDERTLDLQKRIYRLFFCGDVNL